MILFILVRWGEKGTVLIAVDLLEDKPLELKYLIATNINEWFIFDANTFEKAFAQNKRLVGEIDLENLSGFIEAYKAFCTSRTKA